MDIRADRPLCVHSGAARDKQRIPSRAVVPSYEAVERYGLVWVAFDDPITPIPVYPEFASARMRTTLAGSWTWAASAGRFMENTIDTAHLPIVHPGLLGDPECPEVEAASHVERARVLLFVHTTRDWRRAL